MQHENHLIAAHWKRAAYGRWHHHAPVQHKRRHAYRLRCFNFAIRYCADRAREYLGHVRAFIQRKREQRAVHRAAEEVCKKGMRLYDMQAIESAIAQQQLHIERCTSEDVCIKSNGMRQPPVR
jgi:hypothetical protein